MYYKYKIYTHYSLYPLKKKHSIVNDWRQYTTLTKNKIKTNK